METKTINIDKHIKLNIYGEKFLRYQVEKRQMENDPKIEIIFADEINLLILYKKQG
jgi:hypothetical protein